MRCIRCHKPLSDPASIERGMGPVCAALFATEIGDQQPGKHHITTGQAGIGEDIIMTRDEEDRPMVNVFQQKTYHSPDGFEWGYAGSGPADLALNIMLIYLDEHDAMTIHQDFKFNVLSSIPREGGTISGKTIIDYLNKVTPRLFDDTDNAPKYKRISGQAANR